MPSVLMKESGCDALKLEGGAEIYRYGEGYIGGRYSRYGTFGADTAEYQ